MSRHLAVVVVALSLSAGAVQAAGISVTDAWSRPAAPGLTTGVAYLSLLDTGSHDRLMAASSPKAARVTMHRSALVGGVMTMEAVAGGLDLPRGHAVALAPGGYHLMLEGLKGGLKPGERYPLTLRFAHAPAQTVEVDVRSGPDPMAGMSMK